MFKKVFSIILTAMMILILNNHSFAEEMNSKNIKVALILDTSGGKFSEPEKVYQIFQDSIDQMFKDESQYDIIPVSETDPYVQIYREENDLTVGVEDDYTQTSNRDLYFKKNDIKNIAQHFKSDYVIYARITTTAPRFSDGIYAISKKVNITLDYRVWSRFKNDFVYANRIIKTGHSTSIMVGSGSSIHAIEKGLKKCLKDIEKDEQKIKANMKN